jgi:hypothetical protein
LVYDFYSQKTERHISFFFAFFAVSFFTAEIIEKARRSNSKCIPHWREQRKNVKGRKTEVYDLSELENEEK